MFQTLDSTAAPERERYDYWVQTAIYNLEVSRATERQRRSFSGMVTSLATPSGEMHYIEADGYGGARTHAHIRADHGDELALFHVIAGRIEGVHTDGAESVALPGGFHLYDAARPGEIRFVGQHRAIQVDLPRERLTAILGGSLPDPALIGKALSHSPLGHLFGRHLRQFPRAWRGLGRGEQLGLLDVSESFALTAIETAVSALPGREAEWRANGLYAAALRYIQRHLDRKELDADEIAHALACSRSSLYRAFARGGASVHEQIREMRLNRFRLLLERRDDSTPISVLARRCGLFDTPNVNRAFRRRFGMSPSEWRATHNASDGEGN